MLYTLLNSGWVDDQTAVLTLSEAWVNPTLGRIAHTSYSFVQSPGGLLTVAWKVSSVLLDPYGPSTQGVGRGHPTEFPSLTLALDIVVLLYIIYITAGATKRTARALVVAFDESGGCCCCRSSSASAVGGGVLHQHQLQSSSFGSRPTYISSLLTHMSLESFAVDWFAVGTLIAVAISWTEHAKFLTKIREALRDLPSVTPSDEGDYTLGIPPTPGPGSVRDYSDLSRSAPPWATVESLARGAVESYEDYQYVAVLALIALTLQVCKYASFQSHFGVLGATFARSVRDMYHFAVILVLFMAMFGVWGQFLWGHHVSEWAGGWNMAVVLVRFMMYDYYDLTALGNADATGLTGLFYILFMIGVTNILLWLVSA